MKARKILAMLTIALGIASAQEIRRPTADSDNSGAPCTGTTTTASTTGANAYDGSGTATGVSYAGVGTNTTSKKIGRVFTTWAAPSGSYTSLSLNMNSSCTDTILDASDAAGACFVEYSLDGGSSWTTASSDNGLGGYNQTTATVSLSTSQAFSLLQVRTCASGGQGNTSLVIAAGSGTVTLNDIWTSGVLVTPPAAPTALSATPAANGLSINLTWTDNATTETSYQINKCTGAACSPTSYQTGLAINLNNFNDTTGVSPGTTYGYQACAVNAAGTTCSTTATATTPSVPATPTGLTATYSNTTVSLSWTDVATTETSYTVFRCLGTGCTPASFQTGLAANSTTFNDTAVNGRQVYIYQVVAVNAVGSSTGSNQFTITTPSHQPNGTSHVIAQ